MVSPLPKVVTPSLSRLLGTPLLPSSTRRMNTQTIRIKPWSIPQPLFGRMETKSVVGGIRTKKSKVIQERKIITNTKKRAPKNQDATTTLLLVFLCKLL